MTTLHTTEIQVASSAKASLYYFYCYHFISFVKPLFISVALFLEDAFCLGNCLGNDGVFADKVSNKRYFQREKRRAFHLPHIKTEADDDWTISKWKPPVTQHISDI